VYETVAGTVDVSGVLASALGRDGTWPQSILRNNVHVLIYV